MAEKQLYKKKGIAAFAVGAVITLMVGMGVATLVLIFTTVLSGQTYQLTESKIDAITDEVIKNYTKDAIKSGFAAQKTGADYLPVVVLAIVIAIVLALVLSFANFGGSMGGGSRSAL
jgi:hypothetical protein